MKTRDFSERSLTRKGLAFLAGSLTRGALLLGLAGMVAGLPAATVETLSGGPLDLSSPAYGFYDGDILGEAQYHTPYAVALDATESQLVVADRDNNAIRLLDFPSGFTLTFITNQVNRPVAISVDLYNNLYVLNRGDGTDGSLRKYDRFGDLIDTFPGLGPLNNATGMAMDGKKNIYVAINGNTLAQVTGGPNYSLTTIKVINDAGTALKGITVMRSGWVAACDAGRHGILMVDPANGVLTNVAGFNGAGDHNGTRNFAQLNQPYQIAEAGGGVVVVTDRGNHRVKVVDAMGTITNLYGVSSNYWVQGSAEEGIFPGWWDGDVLPFDDFGTVEAREPVGVFVAGDGSVYTTELYYHLIRQVTSTGLSAPPPFPPPAPEAPTILSVVTNYGQVALTWSKVATATNYSVKRSPSSGGPYTVITSTGADHYTDTDVINGTTYYYVVSASNSGGESTNSVEVMARPPMPPVPDPQIGWVDYTVPQKDGAEYSILQTGTAFTFNNDVTIAIKGTDGTQTFYTKDGSTPSRNDNSAPPYRDGVLRSQVPSTIVSPQPVVILKAIGVQDGRPDSAVVTAEFRFVVANPTISGDNPASFTVTNITKDARMYWTWGDNPPDPSTNSSDPIVAGQMPPLPLDQITNDFILKIRAFRDHYEPSAVISQKFSFTNFLANKISFGFELGEASSDFVGSPGQIFFAPVTLSVLENARIYTLQFNATVTPEASSPPVASGAVEFSSMLVKPDKFHEGFFTNIPPHMFVNYTIQTYTAIVNGNLVTLTNYIPNFTNLVFSSDNLLGVGWLERQGMTNLYDTKEQDLITYSMAHDTMFHSADGKVILGGYGFQVPAGATTNDAYRIQLGRPSATSDGIGTPGSSVFIDTPTNGAFGIGAMNSIKIVTVGQRKYFVGDAAPFRWFNAGDFGNTNLLNDDVVQVFQSAIYRLNKPPVNSDFFDAMDSCGRLGKMDPAGYLVPDLLSPTNGLFLVDDTTINDIIFGDGDLDVCDVYVTYRRSLDPSLVWVRRFWTNGVRGAEVIPQQSPIPSPGPLPEATSAITNLPAVTFSAADIAAAAGDIVQIPIKAQITGDFPLRALMLNLTVEPVDGAPALTVPVAFTPSPLMGQPSLGQSIGNANYSAAWLNTSGAGLTGTAIIGTLTVTVPSSASPSAAYVVHFDHASASPNGLASFPEQTVSGVIASSDLSTSSYGDAVPDSWRLRYFGTLYNQLSQATADADGDGDDNYHEFVAGTDPLDRASCLKVSMDGANAQGGLIRWPSVSGRQYVIESSSDLFGTNWTAVATKLGTGADMVFQDDAPAGSKFYRVQVQP